MSVKSDVINLSLIVNGNQAQNQLNDLRKSSVDLKQGLEDAKKQNQLLRSEFKMAEKEYNDAAKTLEFGSAKRTELAEKARIALQKYTQAQKEFNDKAEQVKKVDEEMAKLRKTIGLSGLTMKELNQEAARLTALKNSAIPGSEAFKQYANQLERVKERQFEVKNGVEGFQKVLFRLKDELKQFGVFALGFLGFQFITSQIGNLISGAGKLSNQLADIRRVTGMTQEEVEALNTSMGKLDTPTATKGLREIAIIAGKLGVAKNDILEFVQATDMLVVALGDELGDADQITTQLGKIIGVFDKGDKKVTGEKLTLLGNAIVDLANKGVASGGFIVDFTQRLAGLADTADLALPAVMGLAAGLEESGQRSESSSTAVIKVMGEIAKDVPKFAKIANKGVEEFSKTLKEKPIEALIQVAEGLTKGKKGFEDISKAFADAGEDGARIITTLGVIGGKADFFRQKITDAGSAIQNTDSITEAFSLRNENLGGILDKIGKDFNKLMTSNAVVNFLKDAAIGAYNFMQVIKNLPQWIAENRTAIIFYTGMILAYISAKTKATQATLQFRIAQLLELGAQKLATAQTAIAIAFTNAYAYAKGLLTGEIKRAAAAQQFFNLVLKQNPIGWAIMLITGLATAISFLADKTREYTAVQKLKNNIQNQANEAVADEVSKIRTLHKVVTDGNISYDTRKKALKELIAINPEYLSGLTLENIKTQEGVNIINKYVAALREKARAEAATQIAAEKMKKDMQLQAIEYNLEKKLATGNTKLEDLSEEEQAFIGSGRKQFAFTASVTDKFTGSSAAKEALAAVKVARVGIAEELKVTDEIVKKSMVQSTNNLTKEVTGAAKTSEGIIEGLKNKIKALEEVLPKLTSKDAIAKNLAETNKLKDELDRLTGSKSRSSNKEESEYDRLKKELLSFKKEVDKIKRDNTIDAEAEDKKELARIEKKYADLVAKAQDYLLKVHKLKKGKSGNLEAEVNSQLGILAAEKSRELAEANQKSFVESAKKEYQQALADSSNYFESLKKIQAERLVAGEINEKTYHGNIAAIEAQAANQQIAIAQDYSKVVKEASADLTKFKGEQLKKQTAEVIANLQAQVAEEKLIKEIKEAGAEAAIKRKLVVNTNNPLSAEYQEATKELIAFEKTKALKAAEIKKQEAIRGLEAFKGNEFEKRAAELEIEKSFQNQIDLINAEADQKEAERTTRKIDAIKSQIDTTIQLFSNLASFLNNLENRQLQREIANNNRKRDALKKHLSAKLINEAQYNLEVKKLDEEEERRKKQIARNQAKREKALNIFSAIVNTGAAVVKMLADPGGFAGLAMSVMAGITGALQVASIASAPLPELAKGDWIRKGDKHSAPSGGIPAMIERDEAVMSAAAMTDDEVLTVTGNTAQITAALNARKGGVNWAAGAVISMPQWKNTGVPQINPGIVRVMEQGGVVRPINDALPNNNTIGLNELKEEVAGMRNDLQNFNTRLHSVVSIKEYRRTEAEYEAAKKASGFGG